MSQTVTPTADPGTFLGPNPGLTRLYDNVQAMVPSAGLTLIKLMTWNTIEEFYLQSTSKRVTTYWTMGIGQQVIDFNPYDANWQVAWVLELTGLPNFTVDPPALVTDVTVNSVNTLRTGTALLALKPVSYSAQLPPELFIQWFETIMDGILFRLHNAPTKPYSDPKAAMYHGRRFRKGIAQARGIAQKGFTDGGGIWQFPQTQGFALGRRKN